MKEPKLIAPRLLWCALAIFLVFVCGQAARAGTLALFRTSVGNIEVELFDQDKPVTVQNFIRYVQTGAYTTNLVFHRYVTNFAMQGGGFYVINRHSTNASFASVPTFGTIPNEFSVGPRLSNIFGTIAMAKVGGNPDSASSQWFFNLTNNAANLDANNGGFTVFGRVIRGMNTLNQFTNLFILQAGGVLNELPVRTRPAAYEDLIYADILLLTADIKSLPNGHREIGWISVRNKTNRVEFTTNFPPVWRALGNTVGDGNRTTLTDSSQTRPWRFYRVRVDY